MAPQTVRVKEENIRGPLRDNDGRVVVSPEPNPSFSDDDSLFIRSMDSSRDEMFDSPPIGRLKIACDPPIRLVSCISFTKPWKCGSNRRSKDVVLALCNERKCY